RGQPIHHNFHLHVNSLPGTEEGCLFPQGRHRRPRASVGAVFRDLGGEIRLESEVTEIVSKGAETVSIITKDGQEEGFGRVVSNADVCHTYDSLLRREPRVEGIRQKLRRKTYSMSLFLIY